MTEKELLPILTDKNYDAPSALTPKYLLHEARQTGISR